MEGVEEEAGRGRSDEDIPGGPEVIVAEGAEEAGVDGFETAEEEFAAGRFKVVGDEGDGDAVEGDELGGEADGARGAC